MSSENCTGCCRGIQEIYLGENVCSAGSTESLFHLRIRLISLSDNPAIEAEVRHECGRTAKTKREEHVEETAGTRRTVGAPGVYLADSKVPIARVYQDVTESVGKIKLAHQYVGSERFVICNSTVKWVVRARV